MYLSITGVTPDNKLAKYQPFETMAEAEAHAVEYNGFAIADPGGNKEFWIVDAVAKTVTQDTASETVATTNRQWDTIRTQRQPLLDEADVAIFKLEDVSGDASAWRTYRQALRDITEQADPDDIVFPEEPS
tara:strand:- start:33 stop:425 length:393 start_codon:yes stop_codon:yes gene_type:complete